MDKISNRDFVKLLKRSVKDYEKMYERENYDGKVYATYAEHFIAFDTWCADMDEHGNYSEEVLKKIKSKKKL